MAWHIFVEDKAFVTAALRRGEFDYVEVIAKVTETKSFRRLLGAFLRPQRPPHHEGQGRQTAPPAARSLPMASMLPSRHPLSHDRGVLCKQKRVAERFTHSAAFFYSLEL